MVNKELTYFDLRAICNSGQVFRMYEREPGVFDIYSNDKYLRVIEKRDLIEDNGQKDFRKYGFQCSPEEYNGYWRCYFDMDRDYESIVRNACSSGDEFVRNACLKYSGIRILHQDIWEMMISFIISQQKQIPSIRKCIENLCRRYGEKRTAQTVNANGEAETAEWYTFPTPCVIAEGGAESLEGLSLGYRARYIYETALQYLDHGISDEELEAMSYSDAKKYLMTYTGIGEKVANCILLFGAGFVNAFPIDTHIKDILYREYYCKNTPFAEPQESLTMADYERMTEECFCRYSPNRGIVQQWVFAAEIERGNRAQK